MMGTFGSNYGNGMGYGMSPFESISMLLFWGLIAFGVYLLYRRMSNNNPSHTTQSPLDILKERYAKGEIDKKEFQEKRKDIE